MESNTEVNTVCFNYFLRMTFAIIMVSCLYSSIVNIIFAPRPCYIAEPFASADSRTYKKYSQRLARFSQHISLTAPNDKQDSPASMMIGTADKTLFDENGRKKLSIKIMASLFILKGSVYTIDERQTMHDTVILADSTGKSLEFGLNSSTQAVYKAYLIKDRNLIDLGVLSRHGDKTYRLHFETGDDQKIEQLSSLREILVGLVTPEGKVVPMLVGTF